MSLCGDACFRRCRLTGIPSLTRFSAFSGSVAACNLGSVWLSDHTSIAVLIGWNANADVRP
jgi:hypothetical protein